MSADAPPPSQAPFDEAWRAAETEPVVRTSDVHSAVQSMSRAFVSHTMRVCGERERFTFDHNERRLHRVSFNLVTFGTDVDIDVKAFEDFYTVMLVLQGTLQTQHGAAQATAGPGSLLVFNSTTPTKFRMRGRFRQMTLRIERALLEQVYRDHVLASPSRPIEFRHDAGSASSTHRELAAFMLDLWRGLASPESVWSGARVAGHGERALIVALLDRIGHDHEHEWSAPATQCDPPSIRRAERFIRAQLTQPLTIADIAGAAGVSASALNYLFGKYRCASPMRYLTRERLKLARDRLQREPEGSVTEIALACGFSHLSRFAGEYRRVFGELPSATLQRTAALLDTSPSRRL